MRLLSPPGACCAVLCVLSIACCGCGDGAAEQQLETATHSVQQSLDAWQRGEQADSLTSLAQPIEFHDDHWGRSARLVEHQIINTYIDTDGSARCAVELTVQEGDNAPQSVQVTYQVVRKENRIVIARDPMS